MNIFGWKSTGRGLLRPAKTRARQDRLSGVRAYGQTGLGDWPRSYEAQIRELYLGNVIAQRAVGILVHGLAAAPLSTNDPVARSLVTTSTGGQVLLETMASHLLLHGNAFVEILPGADGRPAELYALRPERVTIEADNLPFLAVSQAQKEVTHNEALVRIDALLHAMVESVLSIPPTLNESDIGKCWLIGSGAIGDWLGKSGHLAIWTGNDWRFIDPIEGMKLRLRDEKSDAVFDGNSWVFAAIINNPSGGSIIDVEARQAMTLLLEHMRSTGYVTR